jgi:hypothetical protein
MSGNLVSFALIVTSMATLACIGAVLMVLMHAFRR